MPVGGPMRSGIWAKAIAGAMIGLLLMQPQAFSAKATAKPRHPAFSAKATAKPGYPAFSAKATAKPGHPAFSAKATAKPKHQAFSARASAKPRHRATVATGKHVVEKKPESVQIVTFPDTEWRPVKIIRGGLELKDTKIGVVPAEKAETVEIVTFGNPKSKPVRVLRGDGDQAATLVQPPPANGVKTELVTFADPRVRPVTVLRGSVALSPPVIDLFGPAREPDLDRVAFAVDGAESSHGTDLRMWRREPSGPQGPMQVSAAAAEDLGGGDRFDIAKNRQLGRAYLARMYRRYGNWPEAIAAYNWGPRNMDSWISSGRPSADFPIEVERYRDRVLRDVCFAEAPGGPLFYCNRPFSEIAPANVRGERQLIRP
ncbi:MAG TPA: lytic transglycosylase domain-containing protein [Stellaceae bacterium]|nr:lytic transglycosylase domain-containing protein [Stellaceae bacterium]